MSLQTRIPFKQTIAINDIFNLLGQKTYIHCIFFYEHKQLVTKIRAREIFQHRGIEFFSPQCFCLQQHCCLMKLDQGLNPLLIRAAFHFNSLTLNSNWPVSLFRQSPFCLFHPILPLFFSLMVGTGIKGELIKKSCCLFVCLQ